ncbi:MAG: late competence protein ComER [Sporolactobacillus sp.]
MKVGIIGTGNMGSLLIEALIKSKSVKPKQINITNQTASKAEALKEKYPGLKLCGSPAETIQRSTIVFLCVRPLNFFSLLQSVREEWRLEQTAISITSPITITQLERLIPCHVARAVPSIVNQSLAGSVLVTFGTSLNDYQKFRLWDLLSNFSQPLEVNEACIRAASDIASCGPAFLTFYLEKMIEAAAETTPLTRKEATSLVTEMVIGFGKLLEQQIYTLSELREKVTVKGGVTGIGLNVLKQDYQGGFERLFAETQKKFTRDHQAIDPLFKEED